MCWGRRDPGSSGVTAAQGTVMASYVAGNEHRYCPSEQCLPVEKGHTVYIDTSTDPGSTIA